MSIAWLSTFGILVGFGADDSLDGLQLNTWPAVQLGLHHAPDAHGPKLGLIGRASLNLDNTSIIRECPGYDALRIEPDNIVGGRLQLALPIHFDWGAPSGPPLGPRAPPAPGRPPGRGRRRPRLLQGGALL